MTQSESVFHKGLTPGNGNFETLVMSSILHGSLLLAVCNFEWLFSSFLFVFLFFFGEESWQYLTWRSDRTSLFVVSVRKFLMENDVCEPNLEQPRSSSPVFVFCRFTSLQYSQFRLCKGLQEYWHFFWQISTPHTNSPEFFWILPKFQAK